MKVYKPWDFCKSIDCDVLNINKETQADSCLRCKAYQMHQYLREHGQILEEGSALQSQLAEAQASVTQLGIALVQERERFAEAQAEIIESKRVIIECKHTSDLSRLINDVPLSITIEDMRSQICEAAQELEQLRKVRDAAEKAIYTKSQVGKTRYEYDFSKALCQVQLALAQAKGAE